MLRLWKPCIAAPVGKRNVYGFSRIGNRDVVGHGINGSYTYKDDAHFPFPAVRFMENNPTICCLREKEMGDWRCMSVYEKKALYRASFCQTFAEFQINSGSWKFVTGWALLLISLCFWARIFIFFYVNEPLPEHIKEENQKLQLRRMLEIRAQPIDGLSSNWDYFKDHWKRDSDSEEPDLRTQALNIYGIDNRNKKR